MEKNLELYGKIPDYYPGRSELGATIQELISETAQEPARLRRKQHSRQQLWMIWLRLGIAGLGPSSVIFGVRSHDQGLAAIGLAYLMIRAFMTLLTLDAFGRSMNEDEKRIKIRRAAFIKNHTWPENVELEAKPSLLSRVSQARTRFTTPARSRTSDADQ